MLKGPTAHSDGNSYLRDGQVGLVRGHDCISLSVTEVRKVSGVSTQMHFKGPAPRSGPVNQWEGASPNQRLLSATNNSSFQFCFTSLITKIRGGLKATELCPWKWLVVNAMLHEFYFRKSRNNKAVQFRHQGKVQERKARPREPRTPSPKPGNHDSLWAVSVSFQRGPVLSSASRKVHSREYLNV